MNQRKNNMSPSSDPRYFGKSPFDHLKNVASAANAIMHPELAEKEVTPEEPTTTTESTTTEQEKTNG
jgi:hypothetical protein